MALFLSYLLQLLAWLIIARALLSWFPNAQNNQLVQILNQITDPIMQPLQRILPRFGMFDFSPLVAVLVLIFLSRAVAGAGA